MVVKVGTKVLSRADGGLDEAYVRNLVAQISALKQKGVEVVLITSGAGGTGRGMLVLHKELDETAQKQVFAAVGQAKLMAVYGGFFAEHGYLCAQVLATKEDFRDQTHYDNMKNCFEALILESVVPIVNENDVVATTELLFTDNDELAGLVAKQLGADALVILTSVEGFLADGAVVPRIDVPQLSAMEAHLSDATSAGGRGGMRAKFAAAAELSRAGIAVHIAHGKQPDILARLLSGESVGTLFAPS
jgi:glutamate 5-kinase